MPTKPPIETSIANRLAAGGKGTIVIGDETFLVSQPTDQDRTTMAAEFMKMHSKHHQAKLVALFREFNDYNLAKLILEDVEADTKKIAPNMDGATYRFNAVASSVDGASFLVWLLTRKDHPDLTLAKVREHVNDDNAAGIGLQLLAETSLETVDPNSPGASGSPS